MILILCTSVSAAEYSTVWGPGESYKVTFLHSGNIHEFGHELVFNNLPVTEFKVKNFTNTALNYDYVGYGNLSYSSMLEMQIDREYSNSTSEYMSGGFPVLFPIQFNNHDNWIEFFISQVETTQFNKLDPYLFFSSLTTTDNTHASFVNKLNFTSIDDYPSFIFPFQLIAEGLQSTSIVNATFALQFEYTINTGALFYYNYTLRGFDSNSSLPVHISEQLDFVAILPPLNAFFKVEYSIFSLFLGMLSLVIIRKVN